MITENHISPVLQMLKIGIKSKQPAKTISRKTLYLYRFIKYGCAVVWWGFLVYVIFKSFF